MRAAGEKSDRSTSAVTLQWLTVGGNVHWNETGPAVACTTILRIDCWYSDAAGQLSTSNKILVDFTL